MYPGASPAERRASVPLPPRGERRFAPGATTAGRRAGSLGRVQRRPEGAPMTRRSIVLLLAAVRRERPPLLLAGAGQAASRTQTLRFFDKPVSIKLTRADGTVVARAPYPEARPGDTLDVDLARLRRQPRHHAKRWTGEHTPALPLPHRPADLRVAFRDRRLTARLHRQPGQAHQRHRDLPGRNRPRRLHKEFPGATTPRRRREDPAGSLTRPLWEGRRLIRVHPGPLHFPIVLRQGSAATRQCDRAPLTARRKSSALDGLR